MFGATRAPADFRSRPASIITAQSSSLEVFEGQDAAFSVTAVEAVSYQWQSSPDGSAWSDISGATSSTYTKTATVRNTDNGLLFRCVCTNAEGANISNAAALSVWNPLALGTNLGVWLDPTFGLFTERTGAGATTPTSNGGLVGTWRARNGNINGVALSDAGRPILNTSLIKGTPAIVLNGTSNFLDFSADLSEVIKNKNYAYIFCAGAIPWSGASLCLFIATTNGATSPRVSVFVNVSGHAGRTVLQNKIKDTNTTAQLNFQPLFGNNTHRVMGFEMLWPESQLYLRLNKIRGTVNNVPPTFTGGPINAPSSDSPSTTVRIGASANSTGFLNGSLGHFVICTPSSALTTPEIERIEDFISYKSGYIHFGTS